MLVLYRPDTVYTITHEPDEDFRKYLSRKLRTSHVAPSLCPAGRGQSLDISLDDAEGDVVAGAATLTYSGTLYIDLLWVAEPLRGRGIGQRLMHMAEAEALKRGCQQSRLSVAEAYLPFCQALDYAVTGRLQDLHTGQTYHYLNKRLRQENAVEKDLA